MFADFFVLLHPMKRLAIYLLMLLVLVACSTSEAEHKRMRDGLDSLNERNRTDQPFTVQEVQPYVRFFDSHGTPNDRVLAYYLLGRAYYEHGEAPMALQCYHDAADCADTTFQDFDYAQLSRVYGQMGDVFYYQGLYQEALVQFDRSVALAWKGKDTLLALRNYEQKSFAYLESKDTTSAIDVIEDVGNKYSKWGKPVDAAISFAVSIKPLINKGDYIKAKRYMDKYETLSGRFDSHGNIESGREIYYKFKGLFYLYTKKLDSAEYYFRKELNDSKDFGNRNSAANGLAQLFQITHQLDSATKYALYAYVMLDSVYAQRTTQEVERMKAMFDYGRHQKIAQQEKEKASEEKAKRQISIFLLLLIALIASLAIYKMYAEKKRKQAVYVKNLKELEQAQSDVLQLRLHAEEFEELIALKEKIIEEQSTKLQENRKKTLQDHAAADKYIKESAIYQSIQKKPFGQKLTVQELRDCRKLIFDTLPEFNDLLLSKQYKMNVTSFDVCMLFRLGFKSKEISNMLDISQGRVSQICTKVLHDVFKEAGGGVAKLTDILYELY